MVAPLVFHLTLLVSHSKCTLKPKILGPTKISLYHSKACRYRRLKIWAAEVMIYGEDFTQRTETAKVEMKIMID